MKNIIIVLLIASFFKMNAQGVKYETISIKTSAICDECKETIEKALAYEKGVKKSDLDVKTKIVTVIYNPEKTTPEKIRQAISSSGYDADEVKADKKAYENLSGCCKKTESPENP